MKLRELIFAKFKNNFFRYSFFPFGSVVVGVGEIVELYEAKEISSQLYSPRNVKSLQVKEHIILPKVY